MDPLIALEDVDFGATGTFPMYQYRQAQFNQLCLGANSTHQDATGLRVYAGAHVLARFLGSTPGRALLHDARLVELGCGTGAVGSVTAVTASVKKLLVTDGDARAVALAQRNVQHTVHAAKPALDTSASQLLWGPGPSTVGDFDIVIGCELMYYKTNLDALLATVLALVDAANGLFLHAHLFRKDEHDADMTAFLTKAGWATLAVPVPSFVPYEEMRLWPNWLNTCCLVSGPKARIAALAIAHPKWRPFVDVATTLELNERAADAQEAAEATASDTDSDDGVGGLFG
ncbi:hypothetical protein SPRG_19922 [Saprolegnia parasitica CBS 223.65]|uniref:Methyltransferase domain-containing protein n=1 Tax=Saprolegnia parasitica (strain CBS 223.65) TaxID=695850 RepID=A0A067CEU3_SAPPC|nr:hypothetical protein SPRG_19922 [Saprolegnia parasitica CBS 223.65]KDO29259.1 hypothetical protein SPRG_19922 [Saprolegnia parasitica CBS 223.65]|eukprot:XP_012200147.1 hypothetical protein SPRG_19922 [Saprolegnia parasitica CBS 223.65]